MQESSCSQQLHVATIRCMQESGCSQQLHVTTMQESDCSQQLHVTAMCCMQESDCSQQLHVTTCREGWSCHTDQHTLGCVGKGGPATTAHPRVCGERVCACVVWGLGADCSPHVYMHAWGPHSTMTSCRGLCDPSLNNDLPHGDPHVYMHAWGSPDCT